MLNIFIIPSTIRPIFGVVSHEERFKQTLDTIESIHNRVKQDYQIVLIDSSSEKLSDEQLERIKGSGVNLFLDYSNNKECQEFNRHWLKSHGENYLLLNAIETIKRLYDMNIEGRMYKLGGRCKLLDAFDINDHTKIKDKYVFKKRLNTWRSLEQQRIYNSTNLLETRLYSWPFNFVEKYINVIKQNFQLFNHGLDTEHAHFINIPKNELFEYDKVNVGCIIAASGEYIED